jgi:hypothetical protein
MKDMLPRMQEEAIIEGLDRLGRHPPTMRLMLTPLDAADLGLKTDEADGPNTVDAGRLATKARSLMNGVDLVRVRGFANPSLEELERTYLNSEPAEAPPDRPIS